MTNSKNFTAIFLLYALLTYGCADRKKSAPTTVQLPVAEVMVKDIPVRMEFAGQTDGYYTVNIDARSQGYLRKMLFREGSAVSQGQLLYVVEPAPYAAQTAQSRAAEQSAMAALRQAQKNYDRIKPLAEFNAASQSDLDAATAQLSQAEANLASAQAALKVSNIELSYTEIRSPISGIIGKTMVDVGAFVGAGSPTVTLNTVSMVDSVIVDFYIPETLYTTMIADDGGVKIYGITLTLSTGEEYPHKGRFRFLDRQVQSQTGAIQVEVVFPNPQTLLRPGGFALIGIVSDTLKNACLVPSQAINQIQGADFVYVLGNSGSVRQQSVLCGGNIGNLRVITTGLSGGETVITEGFHKLYPGVKVEAQTEKK